jgi:WXG100 family type VII secretion target
VGSAEILAGYAGGGVVTTAVAKIKDADAAAVTTAATKLSTAATDVSTHSGEVAGSVTTLDAAWEGASADAFVAYMGRFKTAGADIGTAMSNAATALTNVANAITGAKTYISTRCDQALTDIRTWSDNHPNATTAEFDTMTTSVCAGAAADIDTHLEGTEETLAAALRTVNTSKAPATTFSALPEPNTQPFTPQSGQPIEWIETPEPQANPANPTNPANATGGQQQNVQQASTGTSGPGGGSDGGGGAGGGGGGGGLGSSGGPPAGGPPPGNVQEWINQAIEILRQNGIDVSEADAQRIWQIIQHESGGNPHAINNWDSNAAKGTPSKGLMQCIDPTFDSYKLAGHGDIWNPVDNICAGVNYAISRYGSLANVPGIKATASGGSYVGY